MAFLLVYFEHTLPQFIHGGHIGVDLFFVLSGFLITTILLKERTRTGTIAMRRFYLRRALRLLPALYVMTGLVFGYLALTRSPEEVYTAFSDAVAVVFYYFNWVVAFAPNWLDRTHSFLHLWSLSVEEQFYLVWPALMLLLLSSGAGRWWLLGAIIVGIIGPAVGRLILFTLPLPMEHYFRTDLRFDNLMWGALGAWILHFVRLPIGRVGATMPWVAAICLFGILVASSYPLLWSGVLNQGGYSVFGLAAALLITISAAYQHWALKLLLGWSLLRWTGRLSYGLYLWHQPILMEVQALVPTMGVWDRFTLVSVTSIAVASASYYWLELPFLRMKDRLDVSPAEPADGKSLAAHSPAFTAPKVVPILGGAFSTPPTNSRAK